MSFAVAAGLAVLPLLPRLRWPSSNRAAGHTVQGALSRRHRRHGHAPPRDIGAANAAPAKPMVRRPADGGVPLEQVGSAVTVVTGEQLRAQQVRTAADALRSLPGVAVSRTGGFGNLTQVRIRGAEGNHTLVLIDGIEANDLADGEFDFSNLSAEDIERIEVIRGPMSGLYGSNAVGGVINIITRDGKGPLTVTMRSEGGSFGTRDLAVRASGGNDNAHAAVSYSLRDTDGFNISPRGGENDGSSTRHAHLARRGQAAAGCHARFHRAQHCQDGRRDGFGDIFDPALAGTLATAFDDRSTLGHRVLLGGATCAGTRSDGSSRRSSAPATTHRYDRHRPHVLQLQQEHQRERQVAYLATYRLRRLRASAFVFRPHREGGGALHA